MTASIIGIAFLAFNVFLELTADTFLKWLWVNHPGRLQWIHTIEQAILIYALATIGWLFALKYIKLSYAELIYALLASLAGIAIGVYYFHETISLPGKFGIVLGLISIVLLSV